MEGLALSTQEARRGEGAADERDLAALASAIARLGPVAPSPDKAWTRPPALKVIDCVLSLNRRYDGFVVPRRERFAQNHPAILSVADLSGQIDEHESPAAFARRELQYDHPRRADALAGVVRYLLRVIGKQDEEEALRRWALTSRPGEYAAVGVSGFGIAGFQYLRMLFGANTTKPDVHIIRWVQKAVGRRVTAIQALELLEAAAKKSGVSARDLDSTVWGRAARPEDGRRPRVKRGDPVVRRAERLLRQYAAILGELRDLGVARSKNNPVAEYAEWLVSQRLGLTLATKSQLGWDAKGPDGIRYQIKSRRLTPENKSTQLGFIRNLDGKDFDELVAVLFNEDFTVKTALLVPHATVKQVCQFVKSLNAWRMHVRPSLAKQRGVRDITQRLT